MLDLIINGRSYATCLTVFLWKHWQNKRRIIFPFFFLNFIMYVLIVSEENPFHKLRFN